GLAKSFKPPAADDKTFRELIEVFIAQAMRNDCANSQREADQRGWFCRQVGSLLPEIEKIDAARAATLKRWASEDESQSRWSSEGQAELADLGDSATVDEILALATKYPQMKDDIYFRAIRRAAASGEYERARKMAADSDVDPDMRTAILAEIDRVQKWNAITEEEVAEMQRALPAVRRIEDRVTILMAFASRIGPHDRKSALKFLDQASEIIDGANPGKQQTETKIGLATMYCAEKSNRGLAIMESLMPTLNELVGAAVKLHGYENQHLRDGEWNMSNESAVGTLLTGLAQNAGYFAWCDFDRATNLVAQFERPEIRLMAQLKLAQGILSGPPKRSPRHGQYFRH
ncbi:MAG TPA: hypothetical protein VGW36_05600, partial [Pyrinomonadaceae bacterium]|nr:hypothetical protein [Pyrinomonadaceae bacterium]